MNAHTEMLEAWEAWLRATEEDLSTRERAVLDGDASPAELLAFAALRDKIASGRDLIGMAYDDQALSRDRSALTRDVDGSQRDLRARELQQDRDPGFGDRWLAGTDRDLGAGDRGDSHDDRGRSKRARQRAADDRSHAAEDRDKAGVKAAGQEKELGQLRAALESRHNIGIAQGLLMAEYQVSPEAAFAVLVRLSQHANAKLRDVAADLVTAFESEQGIGAAVLRAKG